MIFGILIFSSSKKTPNKQKKQTQILSFQKQTKKDQKSHLLFFIYQSVHPNGVVKGHAPRSRPLKCP